MTQLEFIGLMGWLKEQRDNAEAALKTASENAKMADQTEGYRESQRQNTSRAMGQLEAYDAVRLLLSETAR